MKIKKIMALLTLTAVLFTGTAGCAGQAKEPASTTPADIGLLNEGVLKVAMEIGYPPFEFYADDGVTPMGMDVELAAELATLLGVTVEYEDTAWDGIFSGLDIDKYDCVISAVTINASRMKDMDFSTPYIENWQSIAVKKGAAPITSLEGLNGLVVGYQDATTSAELLEELIATGAVSCTTSAYDKVMNAFDDLRLGRVDAVLSDSTVAEGYTGREPDQYEITWHQKNESGAEAEKFGVAVKKGNQKLQDALNNALKQLEDSGKLSALRTLWLS